MSFVICFLFSLVAILALTGPLLLFRGKREGASKRFYRASLVGLIAVVVLYVPLFIFNAPFFSHVDYPAPGGGLALMPLIVGSACVIPVIAGILAVVTYTALLLFDKD